MTGKTWSGTRPGGNFKLYFDISHADTRYLTAVTCLIPCALHFLASRTSAQHSEEYWQSNSCNWVPWNRIQYGWKCKHSVFEDNPKAGDSVDNGGEGKTGVEVRSRVDVGSVIPPFNCTSARASRMSIDLPSAVQERWMMAQYDHYLYPPSRYNSAE